MSLVQKLRGDLKDALKNREKERVSALRLMLANIGNAEIAKGGSLEEPDVLGVIARQAKQHRESIDAFRQGNRGDLVAKEEKELAIVQGYLPQQMSREDIVAAARKVISDVGARGPGDKGKVMGQLMPQVKGKAEGSEVNALVTELLANL